MRQVKERRRVRLRPVIAALAVTAGTAVVAVSAPSAGAADLITDHVVEINETVSDAGFVHPGVGLTADDLRNAQDMVRSGEEPWASYFKAMTETNFASTAYRASNSVSASQPDKPADAEFDHVGLRYKETNDSFGALTQSLMWVTTGDEVYRRNAVQALRTWSNMNPDAYKYFADAHIHTGHPLYQFLMAAEIIRATEPVADDSPGEYDGYDVVWSAEDDEKLLTNFANPVVETFLFSNERWMNQHNFGLFGRVATAIYADDAEGYATGVEWTTVNSGYDGYDNGAVAPQIPVIEADDPANPYGEEFTQVREMGRDQAHGETNIDNFAGLARMLEVQGTKVDPQDGTVSTADDAVDLYEFMDNRLLGGADAFFGFMMGAPTPWIDEQGTGGTISEAYRGRMFNPTSELYYQYKYEQGVDVESEAPWVAELHERGDGPYYYYGTGKTNFWAPGDKNPEYWVAFPEELAGTAPTATPDTASLSFERASLQLDDRTEIVTEGEETFARADVDEAGTTSVVSRMMYGADAQIGVLVRSDGPATMEVANKEAVSGANEAELEPKVLSTVEIPDTNGEWRYVTYSAAGTYVNYYTLTGDSGTTVDLKNVTLSAASDLTAPKFEQTAEAYYLWPDSESKFDLSAVDEGGSPAYAADGLPEGAAIGDAGTVTWTPTDRDEGRYTVQVVADDGEAVAARTVELVVAQNRPKMIDAAVADGVDPDAVYTTATHSRYESALTDAKAASENGTDAEFRAAFTALEEAIAALELLGPSLEDGSLDYTGAAVPTVIDANALKALADGDSTSHTGDLRAASFTLDFGTQYRVAADEFGFQARRLFPNRSQGTNVYGSNDGSEWTKLTESATTETEQMETIPVAAEHQGESYRYFKVQVDEPGVPTDPAYPGLWSIGEFRVFGERSEVPGTVTDVKLSSADALGGRVVAGDTVDLEFSSPTPISDVTATIGGQAVEAASEDGLTWKASAELGEVAGGGSLPITIGHTTEDGQAAEPIVGTTDGKQLYASDESNLLDLGAAQVVDASGAADSAKAGHAARMLDADTATFSDVPAVDGEFYVIWDFGEGAQVTLDRADFLARQDNNGLVRMSDLVLEGSNDLESWTPLTEPAFKTLSWQNLPAAGEGGYRYVRISNGALIDVAELRLFGE